MAPAPLSPRGAGFAILAAVASNMLSKLVIAAALERGRFGVQTAIMTAACWLAGLAAPWATLALRAA